LPPGDRLTDALEKRAFDDRRVDARGTVAKEAGVRLVAKDAEDCLGAPAGAPAVLVDQALLVRARRDHRRERSRVSVVEHSADDLGLGRHDDELLRRAMGDVAERQPTCDAKPARAPRGSTVSKTLRDHVALELCEDRERVEAETRDRVRRAVEPAVNDADRDAVRAEDVVDARPVGGAAREPLERGSTGVAAGFPLVVEALGDGHPAERSVRRDQREAGVALQGA
jgi:hypothetical protein